jgi:hypothetical protein
MAHLSLTKQSTEIRWNNPKESFVCKNFFHATREMSFIANQKGALRIFLLLLLL